MKIFSKIFRIVIAILLIPFCIGSIFALWKIISYNNASEMVWVATLAGFFIWILVYFFIPEPKWIYVLGHELTHALWSLPFGGKLKKIRVSSNGGHVSITKSNFLVSLAPYFFPLYAILIVIIFLIGNFFWNWASYMYLFYFLIGLAYSFHITLTFKILKTKQPDINGEGYFFSAVIIFLGNILVLLIGISVMMKNTPVMTSLDIWLDYSIKIYDYLGKLFF